MPFITKSNLNKITGDLNNDEKLSFEDLYEKDLWLLSRGEKLWLAKVKALCINPEFSIDKYYQKAIPKIDNGKFVYAPNNVPSYHLYKDCAKLTNDFRNYEIPVEIQTRGPDEISKFREWFKENEKTYNSDTKSFLIKLEARFFLKNPPKEIDYKNSNYEQIENNSLESLEIKINNLLSNAKNFKDSSSTHENIINKYGKYTHKAPYNEMSKEEETILKSWGKEYKNKLKTYLAEYFKIKFNPNIEFNEKLLEQLNFRLCSSCEERRDFKEIQF